MPTLIYETSGGHRRTQPLFKKITTIGRGRDNDLCIDDPEIAEDHAHIHFDGDVYTIGSLGKDAEVRVGGRKIRSQRLKEGDVITLGATTITFVSDAAALTEPSPTGATPGAEIDAYRKLYEFSRTLAANQDINRLLATLMDLIIDLTRADKGFLVLMEGGQPAVKVARNVDHEDVSGAVVQLSDTIVSKVVRDGRPIIVADALHDEEFKSSMSVVNLKLSSVMCAPMLERGEVIGVVYVGNDRFVSHFDEHTLDILTVFTAQASLMVLNALHMNALEVETKELREQIEKKRFGSIIGACEGMKEIYRKVRKVAPTDVSVLITGETGTGKELIAHELHERSTRADRPFVVINCGAIPENLLESEFFGHVKGAFTGAVASRKGRFQAADGGTLFLDEIGEMPLNLQVKLLRALQDRTVTRVGGTAPEEVDIRIIAATNRDLEEEIAAGRFREDLYYRLNVVGLHLPPLSDRGDDLMVLARFFLTRYAAEYGSKVKGFAPNAVIAMKRFRWTGNIRQLENRIKKAVILAERSLLSAADLDLKPEDLEPILPLAQAKEAFQTRYINEVLERNNGNRTKTARDLGVDPRTIFRHLEKMED